MMFSITAAYQYRISVRPSAAISIKRTRAFSFPAVLIDGGKARVKINKLSMLMLQLFDQLQY